MNIAQFSPMGSKDFRRPVVVMMPGKNVQPFQVDPSEVTVKVLGEQSSLAKLREDDIEVYVNLMNVQNPQGSFRVEVSAPRDVTIESIGSLWTRELPGFGETFRALSFAEIGPPALLSRATAGVIATTFVAVLPGSKAACRLAMERLILPVLGHAVALIGAER